MNRQLQCFHPPMNETVYCSIMCRISTLTTVRVQELVSAPRLQFACAACSCGSEQCFHSKIYGENVGKYCDTIFRSWCPAVLSNNLIQDLIQKYPAIVSDSTQQCLSSGSASGSQHSWKSFSSGFLVSAWHS